MNRYKCIDKCFCHGQLWQVGDEVDTKLKMNHHFVLIAENVHITKPGVQLGPENFKAVDPMKGVNPEIADTYAALQANTHPITTGMATGLGDTKPMSNMKEMRNSLVEAT